jgi:uncharacterized protein YsxB (DUF464 family)
MVKVRVELKSDVIKITLEGHAGYSKKGEDVVCAGISGVIQFLGIYFFNIANVGNDFVFKNGYGYIEVPYSEENKKLIEAFVEYVNMVGKSYPGTLDIDVELWEI